MAISSRPHLPGLTLDLVPRTLKMHLVTEKDIDDAANLGITAAVYLAFFSLFVGAFVSFVVVLSTTPSLSGNLFAAYLGLAVAAGGVGSLCGVMFCVNYRRSRAQLKELKRDPRTAQG